MYLYIFIALLVQISISSYFYLPAESTPRYSYWKQNRSGFDILNSWFMIYIEELTASEGIG